MALLKRWNVTSPKEYQKHDGSKATFWVNLGRANETKKGHIIVNLNALPLPDANGEVALFLFEDDGSSKQSKPDYSKTAAEATGEEQPF